MIYDRIILRLGEFTLKGRNRGRFERRMLKQVNKALAPFPSVESIPVYGRIYVDLNGESYEAVAERLKHIFGIQSLSPVLKTPPELEAITSKVLEVVAPFQKPSTFKISVRRVWKKFPYDSPALNQILGGHVLRNCPHFSVDVKNPDIELRVEIHEDAAYMYCDWMDAAGGYPYGTNGKAMLLLSGGIDSPVAGWHALRRGLELEAIHFYSYPYTSPQAKEKVISLAKRLAYYSGGKFKLHLVPFTDIQTAIAQSNREALTITLMRRAMLRIAEMIAERNDAQAIVTGDSLGQVASQTLGSMNVIGRAASLPLLRPLVTMDKQEIVDCAERIDTYSVSILPYEDCCTLFVPKSPSTNPNLRTVEMIEDRIGGLAAMLNAAVDKTELLTLAWDEPEQIADEASDWF
ncbi:tRNA 4-thiouridine(8) synthase ThiI [Paenibacillaceae bacterium]|nr:tRNA 4-thiouridine(8) synthase ThiI [Paenibacillaceae bacterium]